MGTDIHLWDWKTERQLLCNLMIFTRCKAYHASATFPRGGPQIKKSKMYFFTYMANRHFNCDYAPDRSFNFLVSSSILQICHHSSSCPKLKSSLSIPSSPYLPPISSSLAAPTTPLPNHIRSCHFTASSWLTLQPKPKPPLLWPVLNSNFLLHFPWSS